MSALRQRNMHTTLTRWVGLLVDQVRANPAAPILEQLITIHEGMMQVSADVKAREEAILRAESKIADAAMDDQDAEAAKRAIGMLAARATYRLTTYVARHGRPDQAAAAQRDAQLIMDALDLLSEGLGAYASDPQAHDNRGGHNG